MVGHASRHGADGAESSTFRFVGNRKKREKATGLGLGF